jgi:hypothetical protein
MVTGADERIQHRSAAAALRGGRSAFEQSNLIRQRSDINLAHATQGRMN